jgi:50S ribosomal subunit-associated GTPase HflX
MVYNKVDRLATPPLAAPGELWISATSGAGVDELKAEVRRRLGRERTPGTAPDSEAEAPLEVGS